MLFLFNKTVVELDAPETHLLKHWKRIGCGDPATLLASDAVDFSIMVVNDVINDGHELEPETIGDLAALLVTKTGANAVLFTGANEARLNVLPEIVLQGIKAELTGDVAADVNSLWPEVA